MSELKPLSPGAVQHAIDKARQYRLLNQPEQAESICLDILAADASNEDALIEMTLAISDQLQEGNPSILESARAVVERMDSEYHRDYYNAILCERQALALLKRRGKRSSLIALQYFNDALSLYESAIRHKPADEDEAILRWNFCTRMIDKHRLKDIEPEEIADHGIE